MKVLVVQDDESRYGLPECLAKSLETLEVHFMSRTTALQNLSPQDNYGLILVKTDLNYVVGVKFACALRAQNIDAPITFISDFDDDSSTADRLAPPRCSIGRSPQGGHVLHCCIRRACIDPAVRLALSEALEGKLPVAFEYYNRAATNPVEANA